MSTRNFDQKDVTTAAYNGICVTMSQKLVKTCRSFAKMPKIALPHTGAPQREKRTRSLARVLSPRRRTLTPHHTHNHRQWAAPPPKCKMPKPMPRVPTSPASRASRWCTSPRFRGPSAVPRATSGGPAATVGRAAGFLCRGSRAVAPAGAVLGRKRPAAPHAKGREWRDRRRPPVRAPLGRPQARFHAFRVWATRP